MPRPSAAPLGLARVLTNRRIGFRPHRFNVQLDTWSAPLEDVVSVEPEPEGFLVVQLERSEPQWSSSGARGSSPPISPRSRASATGRSFAELRGARRRSGL